MAAYASQYYHNYYYSNSLDANRHKNYYQNDKEYFRQQPFYPSYYSNQARYQTTFFANPNYSSNMFHQYGMHNSRLGYSNQYDNGYAHKNTWPYLRKAKHRQWKAPDSAFPSTAYPTAYHSNYNAGPIRQFEREIRYFPYPVYNDPGSASLNSYRSSRYPNLSRYPYNSWISSSYPVYQNRNPLPPKIRVIFIPPISSCPQQPCNIVPSMPPFLFNRMSQPFCSLPLPPPLPQISSLQLPLSVQQMAIQRYANPVAVLPFTPNYQSAAQSFAPNYSLPPVVPQQPSLMPTLVAPHCAASLPQSAYFPGDASISQPSNGAYPNTGRAYVPAPPPLNIPVSNQYWVKHSSAHHQIPSYVSNLNFRPSNQSQTASLLRSLQGVQHGYDRNSNYRQQYPHMNSYPIRRPSSNNLPPLPQGAVIISDEYIPKYSLAATQHYTQNNSLHQSRVGNSLSRANELTTYSYHKNRNSKEKIQEYDNKKSPTTEQVQKRYLSNMRTSPPHSYVPESYSSASLSTGSISKLSKSSLDTNTANYAPHKERQLVKKQMTALTRMVNLRYRHPSPDVHAIYNANEKAKSSDEDSRSIATSNTKTSLVLSEKKQNDNRSRSVSCDARSENHDKSIQNRPVAPFPFEKSQQRTSIAQNLKNASLMTTSVSSLDTISANIDTGRNSVSLVSITSNDTKK